MSPEIFEYLMGGVGSKPEFLAPVVAAALKDSEGGPAADILSVEMYTGSRGAGRGAGAPR